VDGYTLHRLQILRALRDACDRGAISESAPKKSLAGGEELTYPVIDRAKCDVCLKCVEACPSTALYDPLRKVTVEDCMRSIRQDKKYYDKSGGGVTISGGEPMSQFEFTLALSKACKAEGFTVALDTTGYAPTERFMEILPYVDLFLYDLKHMDCERHKKLTGVGNELILKNAKALAEAAAGFRSASRSYPSLTTARRISAPRRVLPKHQGRHRYGPAPALPQDGSMKYARWEEI
jgi:pyruvate formate lyase activating enzyme